MQLNLRPRSGFSKLPPELIDIIVDNFSEDKSSLLTCSLLGPLWTHASHRILFRSLTLTGEKGTDEERIPLALIRQRPRFLPYIHELRFIPTVVWRTLITVHPHTFRVLLSLCTGLRSLVIKALRLHGSPPDAAIAEMFESTRRITLDRLDLSTRDVPDRRGLYAIFDALEEVKELRIGVACYNSTVLCAPDAPDLTGRYYLPVSSITLTGEDLGVCMMAVGRALDPHMLRSTRLTNIGLRHLSYANEFLSILPLSLDDLDISFQAPRHAFVSRTRASTIVESVSLKNIACCTRLSFARFRLNMLLSPTCLVLWRKCIEMLLEMTSKGLRRLRVDVFGQVDHTDGYTKRLQNVIMELDWSLLDQVVGRFPQLQTLEIGVPGAGLERSRLFITSTLSGRARSLLQIVEYIGT